MSSGRHKYTHLLGICQSPSSQIGDTRRFPADQVRSVYAVVDRHAVQGDAGLGFRHISTVRDNEFLGRRRSAPQVPVDRGAARLCRHVLPALKAGCCWNDRSRRSRIRCYGNGSIQADARHPSWRALGERRIEPCLDPWYNGCGYRGTPSPGIRRSRRLSGAPWFSFLNALDPWFSRLDGSPRRYRRSRLKALIVWQRRPWP
jgi:hypothetical protein